MSELNQAQIDEFDNRGFLLIKQLIPQSMIDALIVGYDEAVKGKYDVEAWRESLAKGGDPHHAGVGRLGFRFPYFDRIRRLAGHRE